VNYSCTKSSFFLSSLIGHKSIILYYCHFWKLAVIFGEDLFFGEETILLQFRKKILWKPFFWRHGEIIFEKIFFASQNCFSLLWPCRLLTVLWLPLLILLLDALILSWNNLANVIWLVYIDFTIISSLEGVG